MIHSILFENPLPLREETADVPAVLETLVARCLAKEPQERRRPALSLPSSRLPGCGPAPAPAVSAAASHVLPAAGAGGPGSLPARRPSCWC